MEVIINRSYKNIEGGYLIVRAKIPFIKRCLVEFHDSPASGVCRTTWREVTNTELKKLLGVGRNVKLTIQHII